MTVSAHGHALSFDNPKNQPELCGEWCERYFDLLQGGETVVRQPLWRDNCDQTATFPQGGTYIFSRANWCPGEIVEPFSYPVDPNSGEFDIDWQAYSWQPSQWGNTAPRYIVSAQLVTYGPKQQTTDLAVETILSPNRDLDVRNSQSCGLVEVLVKNNGETPIYDIAFDYGIDSGNRHQFAWQGELAANQQVTVNLPGFNWGMFDTDTAQFSVVAKTAGDTQPDNNQAFSHIEAPLMVTSDTVLSLLTGKLPEQTRVEIVDRNGEVVSRWDDFAASTNHDLPLDLSKGCYSLNVYDSGHDGLDNPFTRGRQGKGALKLVSNNGEQQLQADFGRMLQLPFTLDYPLGQCLESTWQSGQPYAEPGEMVSYKGIVYKARHWSYDFEPDKSGPWDAWAPVSYCDGTAL